MADLFDSLFDVNRPQLNAYVTQGQAMAGLRTAQTEEALANAQHARDENDANDQLEGQLTSLFSASGDPLAQQKGRAAAGFMIGNHGNAQQALAALGEMQKNGMLARIADPNTPDADRIALLQSVSQKGDVGQTQNVEGQVVNGVSPTAPPTITQTPVSQATAHEKNAQAGLYEAEAANPQLFHPGGANAAGAVPPDATEAIANLIRQNPGLAGNIRSLTSQGGWRVAYQLATGHPYPDAAAPGAAPGAPGAAPGPASQSGVPNPQLDTGVTPAPGVSFQEQSRIRNYYAGGQGMSRVVALGTMADHAQLWSQIAAQLGNGQFTPTNSINNLWQRTFGGDAPGDLRTAGSFLGREAVRATVNSGAGTGEEREINIPDNASPQQFEGGAATLLRLALGQYRNLDSAARRGGVDISTILDPSIRGVFTHGLAPRGILPAMAGAPGATPGATPQAPSGGDAMAVIQQLARESLARQGIHVQPQQPPVAGAQPQPGAPQ